MRVFQEGSHCNTFTKQGFEACIIPDGRGVTPPPNQPEYLFKIMFNFLLAIIWPIVSFSGNLDEASVCNVV